MIVPIVVVLAIAALVSGVSQNETKTKTIVETSGEIKDGYTVVTQKISIPLGEFAKNVALKGNKMSAQFVWGRIVESSEENESGVETVDRKVSLDYKYFDCKRSAGDGNGMYSKCIQRDVPMTDLEYSLSRSLNNTAMENNK